MSSPDSLICYVADTLGLPLNLVDNRWRGAATKNLKLGPWKINAEVVVCSDVLSPTVATFVVRVKGGIWLYLTSSQKGMLMYVFDGSKLGLRAQDVATVGTGKAEDFIKRIRPVTVSAYLYEGKTWRAVNVSDLDKDGSTKTPEVSGGAI